MFEREHELVTALAHQHRGLWPAAHGRRVRAERGYGAGVADLVVVDYDEQAAARRLAELPPLNLSSEALVVSCLRAASPTPSTEIRQLIQRRLSQATVDQIVDRLVLSGHLVREGGMLTVNDDLVPVLDRLIAIEAKLTDWRKGMDQAGRYREFANQTYLAVPMALAERVAAAERGRFELWRIGLIGVSKNDARVLIGCPRAKPQHRAMRAWAEEVELADRLGLAPRLMQPFTPRFSSPTPAELVAGAA